MIFVGLHNIRQAKKWFQKHIVQFIVGYCRSEIRFSGVEQVVNSICWQAKKIEGKINAGDLRSPLHIRCMVIKVCLINNKTCVRGTGRPFL